MMICPWGRVAIGMALWAPPGAVNRMAWGWAGWKFCGITSRIPSPVSVMGPGSVPAKGGARPASRGGGHHIMFTNKS